MVNEDLDRLLLEKLDQSLTIGPNSIKPGQITIYKTIRGSNFPYPCKHALLATGKYSDLCNSVCNPFLESDVIPYIEDVNKEDFSVMGIYHSMQNPRCFKRCGSSLPGCDPSGSIDVRLLEKRGEFAQYYKFRPEKLLARDTDKHPESLEIHKVLLKMFPDGSEAARKIRVVI
jgi:hypothetical protein